MRGNGTNRMQDNVFNTYGIAPCWLATALRKVEAGGGETPDKSGEPQIWPRVVSTATTESGKDTNMYTGRCA